MNEIVIPEKTAEKIRTNLEAASRMQLALNNFIDGVAAGLDVPDGYRLDTERMVWVEDAQPRTEGADIPPR